MEKGEHGRERRGLGALLRDQRGHATAEAVIMLPFFILIFGGLIFVSKGFETSIDERAITRQHAWAHVMDDCRSRVPSDTEVSDATNPVFGPVGDLFAIIDEIIALIPFFSDYWPGWINEERKFTRRASVDKPAVLGGGSAQVGHWIILMCNERPNDVDTDELATRAWDFLGI